jgi:hypothetical protein
MIGVLFGRLVLFAFALCRFELRDNARGAQHFDLGRLEAGLFQNLLRVFATFGA